MALAGLLSSIRPRSSRRRSRPNRWRQSRPQRKRSIRRQTPRPSVSDADNSADTPPDTSTIQRDEVVQDNNLPNQCESTPHGARRANQVTSAAGGSDFPVAEDDTFEGEQIKEVSRPNKESGLKTSTRTFSVDCDTDPDANALIDSSNEENELEYETSLDRKDPTYNTRTSSTVGGVNGSSLKYLASEIFPLSPSNHTQDSGFADTSTANFKSTHSDIGNDTCSDAAEEENDCRQRLQREGVALEHVQFTPDGSGITGTVLVQNTHYKKCVFVRHSSNQWKKFQDTAAEWMETIEGGAVDRFHFGFHHEIPPATSFLMEFAIACNDKWDNNDGQNYIVGCTVL